MKGMSDFSKLNFFFKMEDEEKTSEPDDDKHNGKKYKKEDKKGCDKFYDPEVGYIFEKDSEVEKKIPLIPISFNLGKDGKKYYTVYFWGPIYSIKDYLQIINILEVADEDTVVTFLMDSPGGSVEIAAMIASAMQNSRATTVAKAVGSAASATMFLWSVADKQEVTDNSIFMFHMSLHGDFGSSTQIKARAELIISYVSNYLLKISLDKGHLLPEEYELIMTKNENIWIDGPTMKKRIGGSNE